MAGRAARSLALLLALSLPGCAGLVGGKPPVSVDEAPRPPQPGPGGLSVQKGRPGYVIGAPRAAPDGATGLIGLDLARRTGFGAVIAPARAGADAEAERRALDAYSRSVTDASQGPLRVYVEVRGASGPDAPARLEIATMGLDKEDAWRLKTLLELVRDAHLRGQPDAARLEVAVSPADTRTPAGSVSRAEKGLFFELPRAARVTYRDTYTAVLGDFLVQWTDLQASARTP